MRSVASSRLLRALSQLPRTATCRNAHDRRPCLPRAHASQRTDGRALVAASSAHNLHDASRGEWRVDISRPPRSTPAHSAQHVSTVTTVNHHFHAAHDNVPERDFVARRELPRRS